MNTAPGKSGTKNVNLREKYKGAKFPNEANFVARSQILMFQINYVFTSECDNLRLAQSLEFNQQFLSLK